MNTSQKMIGNTNTFNKSIQSLNLKLYKKKLNKIEIILIVYFLNVMTNDTKTINYKMFSDRIIEMIYVNNNTLYDRDTFGKEGHGLGKEIYRVGGADGLFAVIRLVEQELLDCEYSNQYLSDLRNLEWSFNGICEEFQA